MWDGVPGAANPLYPRLLRQRANLSTGWAPGTTSAVTRIILSSCSTSLWVPMTMLERPHVYEEYKCPCFVLSCAENRPWIILSINLFRRTKGRKGRENITLVKSRFSLVFSCTLNWRHRCLCSIVVFEMWRISVWWPGSIQSKKNYILSCQKIIN